MLYRERTRRSYPKTLILVCILLSASACTSSRFVQPLPEGKLNLTGGFGGPFFNYQDNPIPMPLSTVTAGYGVTDTLTVFTGAHLTTMAYGTAHVDLGAVKELYRPSSLLPGISVSPALNLMLDRWERQARIYPAIDVNVYWDVFYNDFIYVGSSHWFELAKTRAHGEPQPTHWIPAFHLGYTAKRRAMRYNAELKYLAPWHSNENIVVEYLTPFDSGAIGLYLSVGRNF